MTQDHPITPPPELVQQWAAKHWGDPGYVISSGEKYIATQAARWGADQELEACCKWLDNEIGAVDSCDLRAARRPPPSLKELALRLWTQQASQMTQDFEIIRRALEALPDD